MALANKPTTSTPAGKQTSPAGSAQGLKEYFLGIKSEWGKITWPAWPQIWAKIVAVLIVVCIMTLGLLVIDTTIHALIMALPGKAS